MLPYSLFLIYQIDLLVSNHAGLHDQLIAWASKKIEYLVAKENVTSSPEAKQQVRCYTFVWRGLLFLFLNRIINIYL